MASAGEPARKCMREAAEARCLRRKRSERGALFNGLTIGYLFLGGTGGGALTVLCSLSLVDMFRTSPHAVRLSRQHGMYAWSACLLLLVLGVLCLMADMGVPERALGFLFPREITVTLVGAWALLVGIALCLVFWCALMFDNVVLWRPLMAALAGVGILVGLAISLYTGVLLWCMVSVLAWQTPLVALLFCLSSLSGGIAVVLAMVGFVPARAHLMRRVEALLRADWLIIMLELVLLAVYVAWLLLGSDTFHFGVALVVGNEAVLFWLGLVGTGLLLPLVLERSVTYSNHRTQLLFVAVSVLVGGLALRMAVVGLFPLDLSQTTEALLRAASAATAQPLPGAEGPSGIVPADWGLMPL